MDRKEELKKAYKQNHTPMGVFQITNSINGKRFIGSGTNVPAKINKFKFELKYLSCKIKELQKDYDKFGENSFSFEVIDRLEPKEGETINYKEELETLEQMWIEKVKPEYNN